MKSTGRIYTRMLLCNIFLIHSFFSGYLHSENRYFFKQLSLEDGLSQSFIESIYEDHRGFLWIGTHNGLNRYDNRYFKTYFKDNDYENSLPDDYINFIVEDSLLNLWVSTDQGLAIYNRETDSFELKTLNGSPIRVKSYLLQPDGILFGGKTLYKYSYSNRQLEECVVKDPLKVLKGEFYYIENWLGSYLILANRWNGVWLYDTESGYISRFNNIPSLYNTAFLLDKRKNLWFSSYSDGLKCISPQGEILHNYNTGNSNLPNDIILDIKENEQGIWIATDGGGICLLDTMTGKFQKIEYDGSEANCLPLASVNCLYFDKRENLWAGTIRGGVFGIRKVGIRNYGNVYLGDDHCLSERTILSLYEDSGQNIWIGTDGGGINLFNKETERFRHYPGTFGKRVVSITNLTNEKLLVSLFGEGLFVFDKTNEKLTKFTQTAPGWERQIILKGLSINVEKIAPDMMMFLADSVYLFNLKTQHIKTLKYDSVFIKSNFTANNAKIICSSDKSLYLFSTSNIFRYKFGEETLETIYSLSGKSEINDVCYDPKRNSFWIATTKGFFNYHPGNRVCEPIKTTLFNSVNTLVIDKKDRIWIGGKGLLFCYYPETGKFAILGNSDGAPLNEYAPKACILTRDNSILKGGISGLLYIDKDYELEAARPLDISIMELLIDGLTVKEESINNQVLKIPYDHSTLTVKVVARESDPFRKKMYRFNITGSDIKPQNTYENTLTLHSLPPGNYGLNISCTQRDGGWSEEKTLLTFEVKVPWWKTRLFGTTVLIFLLIAGYLIPYFILRGKRKRLESEKKALAQKNNEERLQFLINISHELRTPLTLIYTPLQRLISAGNQDAEIRRKLSNVFRQVKYMKNMIDTLLDMRKMEVTQEKLSLKPHDINECIRLMGDEFEEEKAERKIELEYILDSEIQPIRFDIGHINIVLSNLLMNAFKYSPDYSKITLKSSFRDGFIRISVTDEGQGLIGVDPKKIFTRFYQGENKIKGSGIGLAFSKTIIEMHNGRIGFLENEEKGMTFYFELPYESSPVTELPETENTHTLHEFHQNNSKKTDTCQIDLSTHTILIVDDEPEILELLGSLFMGTFRNILKATNGTEALALLKNNIPDIIISDVMMPGMDGFEFCRKVKESDETNHIPIILLTAFNNMENTSRGYLSGADIYISKPFEDEVLFSAVLSRLKNREILRSRYNGLNACIPKEGIQNNITENFKLKLDKIINDNIANPELSVQFVAEEIGISKASLYSKMKTILGIGLNDYISTVRIEIACDYLLRSDMTVQQIADLTGFNNQRYFSTVFKQLKGDTPTNFRKINKTADA